MHAGEVGAADFRNRHPAATNPPAEAPHALEEELTELCDFQVCSSVRSLLDDRGCLQGILFVLHTGIQWEWLPEELGFGSGMTC